MSKIKTHRGAAKRFGKTASGKFRRGQSHRSHILTKKSPKRKMGLRAPALVDKADTAMVRQMLPNH